jgi:hypothetical protein
MSRYERRLFFEHLVQLREQYRQRGADDAESCISVDDALRFAERLMKLPPELPVGGSGSVGHDGEIH